MSFNPWLDIPLSDYEAHMALPEVAQAQLVADIFESLLDEHRPDSVAVIGCAGGNGFDRIDSDVTTRVVGVDINPRFLALLRLRYDARLPNLELVAGDIQGGEVHFDPVDMIYAALVLEFVDIARTLERLSSLVVVGGTLVTVVQLPGTPQVTPSPYTSLQSLEPIMRPVDPDQLEQTARTAGFRQIERRRESARGGKQLEVQVFERWNE